MTVELGLPPQPLWLIISGRDEAEVHQRLTKSEDLLNRAVTDHLIGRYLLPDTLWPRAEFQIANRATAAALGEKGPLLRDALSSAGFNTNAMVLTEELVRTWSRAGESRSVIWPTNHVSQWLLKRFVARTSNEILVMGLIYPATNKVDAAELAALSKQLAENHALLSGWELLGNATLKRVQSRMWEVVTPMVVLVLLSLWFAFRRATEILLGVAVLGLSGVCLLATMALAGWDLEFDESNGAAADARHGRGLYAFHPARLAPAWRRSRCGPAFRRAGADVVRRHGGGRVRFARVFQQSGHGQSRQGVRGGHRRECADFDIPSASVVEVVLR